jgi:peroxiredoxin
MKIFTQDVEEYTEYSWNRLPAVVPVVVFKTRVRDESIEGSNPYRWQDLNSYEIFGNKKVLLFSLPGAFTPTCDTMQLPTFERLADSFYATGIDDIYCISVNDAFVMNKWAESQSLQNVKVLPDGSGEFTCAMQMEVSKDNLGFGVRSWRYAIIVENGTITHWFLEDGKEDNAENDPYAYTNPEYILNEILF